MGKSKQGGLTRPVCTVRRFGLRLNQPLHGAAAFSTLTQARLSNHGFFFFWSHSR